MRRDVLALVGHCAWVGMILADTATVVVFVARSWSFDGVYIWAGRAVRTRSGDTLLQRSKGYDDSRACQVFDTESAPRQRAKGMTIRINAGQR